MEFQSPIQQATPLTGLRFARTRLITGIDLHYAEYGDPTGEPILFLHGFTDSWFSFSPVLPHLGTQYRVFMIDQRGHGDSSQPSADDYAMSDLAEDAIAFIEALGLQQVTLIGHSMGSFVAQHVAQIAPQVIARLVLLGSAAKTYTDDLGAFIEAVNTLEDPVADAFARDFQLSTLYRPVPDEFLEGAVAASLKVSARTWRLALREQIADTASAALEGINAPTLILWGDHDAIWPRSQQEILVNGIKTAELRVYAETGHALHWERPAQFARDLQTFITQTTESSHSNANIKPKA